MKKVLVTLLFVALFTVAGKASADIILSLSPGEETVDTSGITAGGTVTVAVNVQFTSSYSLYSGQIDLKLDKAVILDYSTAETKPTFSLNSDFQALGVAFASGMIGNSSIFAFAVYAVGDSFQVAAGSTYTIGTVTLELSNPDKAPDGRQDVHLLGSADAPFGDASFYLNDYQTTILYDAANGPDYGACMDGCPLPPAPTVPVPGALCLLSSGLVGLIGLRRRTR